MAVTSNHILTLGFVGYFIVLLAAVFGVAFLRVKKRSGRTPVDFKLLRSPGETLRQRVAKSDENAAFEIVGAAIIPVAAGAGVLVLLMQLHPKTWATFGIYLAISGAVFLAAFVAAVAWLIRRLKRYRDDWLGYLGEREVAEHIGALLSRGYRIFHDAPARGAKNPFNLDHVVIGPTGVALIETKTRRKRAARPGYKDHVVIYDGRQLVWPWGENRDGLDQAASEAAWLQQFIKQRTGIVTEVRPVLALPGWWVEERIRGPVAVANAKTVSAIVERWNPRPLTTDQIDLIARQLDELCRDVTG